jgi:hypothetical protein
VTSVALAIIERKGGGLAVPGIDLDRLLKLRVVVARCGEMDLARWWNTDRQLGTTGESVLRRGFPRTHHFAQARSVIFVAAHRCAQVFDPPDSVTLWWLTEDVEDAFDAKWEGWLENAASWRPFFENVASITSPDLVAALRHLGLVTQDEVAALQESKLTADGRAVAVLGLFPTDKRVLAQLALGFSIAPQGSLVIPYARIAG